jgi:hypothetical protein
MWLASKSGLASLELELLQMNTWGEFSWNLLDWVVVRGKWGRGRGWGRTTTEAETFIPFNTILIPCPSLKGPFGAVEVTEMMTPFGWYFGIVSNWRNC